MNKIVCWLLFCASPLLAQASSCTDSTVRIMTWNLLNFPSQSNLVDDTTTRLPCYRTVVQHVNPDIIVTQENSASNSISFFLGSVMNANGNQYSAGTFINGYDTDNGIYYRTSCFRFISNIPIQTALRDVNQFTLVHIATNDTIHIFSCHLKASSGAANEAARAAETDSIRKVTDTFSPGTDFMICGDFNFYGSYEAAYQRLLQVDSGLSGNFMDAILMTGVWNNAAYSRYHTQSPRVRSFGGGATGGLDDRFDLMLLSPSMLQPGRITYQDGTMTPVGNDGLHYGDSINRPPNAAVPQNVADALHNAADHLPVYADFDFSPSIGIDELAERHFHLEVFPNPSGNNVTAKCMLIQPGRVEICLYDVMGRVVKIFQDVYAPAGIYQTAIAHEGELEPGNYFVRLTVSPLQKQRGEAGKESVFSCLFTIE